MKLRQNIMSALSFAFAFLLCFGATPGSSFAEGDADVYGLVEYFTWREFEDTGAQILREAGPRGGIGFTYHAELQNGLSLRPRVELYGGHVDYVGQTMAGTPVKSNTNYFAFKFEADAGGKIGRNELLLEPFGGFGFRIWDRDIEDTATASGYLEEWFIVYLRAGLRMDALLSKESKMFFVAGTKFPVYNQNTAYLSDIGYSDDATLHPGKKISFFAEAGFKAGGFKLSAFYDSMRFSQSAPGFAGFFQPRSESDVYGLRIGRSF